MFDASGRVERVGQVNKATNTWKAKHVTEGPTPNEQVTEQLVCSCLIAEFRILQPV
jgi:hypothetical protein